jgi:hypothetical protein
VLRPFLAALLLTYGAVSQSTDQSFPTAVTSNEINGQIRARDMGDSRLTRYFYAFDGGQGDIFINVVTTNLEGSIDVFTADGLKPLAKIPVYGDPNSSETGRLIYLRKPERLLLRVEGRSPNDDAASFRIKFAGSFIALEAAKPVEPPTVADTIKPDEPGVRVNSVGTIVAVVPKPPPPAKPVPEKKTVPPEEGAKEVGKIEAVSKPKAEATPKKVNRPPAQSASSEKKAEPEKDVASTPKNLETKAEGHAAPPKENTTPEKRVETAAKAKSKGAMLPPAAKQPVPDPLAGIHLVIEFKDGALVTRPMNEVVKFSVDKGVLTVISKDGTTARYSILDVAKVTIQ